MDPLLILETLNSRYTKGFSPLLTFTAITLAFAAVVFSVADHILRVRSFRTEKESLDAHIASEVGKLGQQIYKQIETVMVGQSDKIHEQLESALTELDAKLENNISLANAGSSYVDGTRVRDATYAGATYTMALAARLSLEAQNDSNAQMEARILVDECLPNLQARDFEFHADLEPRIRRLTDRLRALNQNDQYTACIRRLTRGLEQAMKGAEATGVDE